MTSLLRIILSFPLFTHTLGLSGHFWHITDLHWDPSYKVDEDPDMVCSSSGNRPATSAGDYGDYVCDSPWTLINSSVFAMKKIFEEPDFILWTGDDTPHVPNEDLGQDSVLHIIGNLTHIFKTVFPNTKVYSAMGNHDTHPKNQFPSEPNQVYQQVSDLWKDWLEPGSMETFRKGAFYSENLLNQTGVRILVLNTNLYYDQNHLTQDVDDPAGQFTWMDQVLTEAEKNHQKVYIVGHVPPGMFEKKRSKPWFRSEFNKKYVELTLKHQDVIRGQFFGHHHTDSFRMFYNAAGSPVGTMFLSPGVTPWKTTLPGVQDGANNPGIRLFEYDLQTLLITDVVTYYLNLSQANMAAVERWEKEYRLTESFRVPDASPSSMHRVLELMANDGCYLQKYYDFNSVMYDLTECDAACRVDHVCAIREVDFDRYEECVLKEKSSCVKGAMMLTLVSMLSRLIL